MTLPPATYGNGNSWPEDIETPDQPVCDHPAKRVVTAGTTFHKQHGYEPYRRYWQCVECLADLGAVVEP